VRSRLGLVVVSLPLLAVLMTPLPGRPARSAPQPAAASSSIALQKVLPAQGRQRVPAVGFAMSPKTTTKKGVMPAPRLTSSMRVRTASAPSRFGAASQQTAGAASQQTVGVAPKPKVGLYNNLNSAGMDDSVNSPFGDSPPDSTGAIGPNHYVEMVNAAIKVWTRALAPVSQSTLQTWVGVPADTIYCDPQIQWDQSSNRWLYAFIGCDPTTSSYQEIDFGWSKTSNPSNLATGWCQFFIETTTQVWDFPRLGHNTKYGIIGVNVFDNNQAPPVFDGAGIFWWNKPANGVTTCPLPSLHQSPFLTNGDGTTPTTTAVPVNTMTSATNGYVVSAYDPLNSTASKLAVFHVDSSGVFHQDSDLNVSSYSAPAPAPQAGTPNVLDTGDGRLTQAVGDPTSGIWTQHTVGGAGGRSVVSWYEIKVSAGVPSVFQEGILSNTTDFVFNAAISPRKDAGGAALIYNRSSASLNPVIAAQIRLTSTAAGTMEPGELILGSSAAFDADATCNSPTLGVPCRWGDYAGASPDPVVTNVVWGTSEINTASTVAPAWLDRNFALSFVTTPHVPTSVTAVAYDRSARVSWIPSTFVPSSPVTTYTITAYIGASQDSHMIVSAGVTSVLYTALTDGVSYTFTVFASNSVGDSPESGHSNLVTPTRASTQSTVATSARITVAPSSPNPLPTPRP
jgi:hypothetical protein